MRACERDYFVRHQREPFQIDRIDLADLTSMNEKKDVYKDLKRNEIPERRKCTSAFYLAGTATPSFHSFLRFLWSFVFILCPVSLIDGQLRVDFVASLIIYYAIALRLASFVCHTPEVGLFRMAYP